MPLSTTQKQEIINEFQTAKGDTGSPEVQIALLTKRIQRLAEHLKAHAHDVHSRRGLLSMIAKRRRLINFLKKVDEERVHEPRGFKSREDKVREELQQKDQQSDDKTPSDWLAPKVYKGSSEV